jgi:hypothetical protein
MLKVARFENYGGLRVAYPEGLMRAFEVHVLEN